MAFLVCLFAHFFFSHSSFLVRLHCTHVVYVIFFFLQTYLPFVSLFFPFTVISEENAERANDSWSRLTRVSFLMRFFFLQTYDFSSPNPLLNLSFARFLKYIRIRKEQSFLCYLFPSSKRTVHTFIHLCAHCSSLSLASLFLPIGPFFFPTCLLSIIIFCF